MEFFEQLTERSFARHLEFVVVGGLALLAWGVPHQTADLDLLVTDGSRAAWKDLLAGLGYGPPQEQGGFVQFAAPVVGAWPVDRVVVGTDTFDRIASSAVPARFGRAVCSVACVNDLLALKFHALRYVPTRVAHKFLADVHALVRRTGGRVVDPAVRDLCLKYGSQEIYDRLTGTGDPV